MNQFQIALQSLFVKETKPAWCRHEIFQISLQPSWINLSWNPGPNAPNQTPLVLLEDVTNVYGDTDIDRNKHIHKKRKLAEGREKTMVTFPDFFVHNRNGACTGIETEVILIQM